MNDMERRLLRIVCEGDIRKAQQQARVILNGLSAKKDERFRDDLLRHLDAKENRFIELPYNLRDLLVAEDVENFPTSRFLLRDQELEATEKLLALYRAAARLAELGIQYLPALLLHGKSGCGKTMLARYIAYRAGLPFVFVKFSNLVDSHLGQTQTNVAKVFDYVRSAPCVLCFDEIDAIGMARGQKDDVGEMNRVVIAMMQELDQLPNNVIIIGTTNRFDRLDEALVRRFPLHYELNPMSEEESVALARQFFTYTGITPAEDWYSKNLGAEPASAVVRKCTDYIVGVVTKETGEKNGK